MDVSNLRKKFVERVESLIESKRDDNNAFLSVSEYQREIGEVKNAKLVLSTEKTKKTVRHYRIIRKYDIITINQRERLIKPVAETLQSKVLYYATNEELFEIIHNAHLAIGHGRRNRMVAEINKQYCNITKETIMLYLRLCSQCQKKSSNPRKGLVTRPILHSKFNSRAQVDLIDMQLQSYKDYRFIVVYQDHLTKSVLLKALKTKRAEEIAYHLLDIYTTFGAPLILHSDNGREFVNSVLVELHTMWPEVRILHGKPRHSQSQGSVERANRDIEEMLAAWMDENNTTDWPSGIKYIQFKKNRALHSGIGRSPYEAMFGSCAKVGLASAGIPHDEINNFRSEEEIEDFLKRLDGNSEQDGYSSEQENETEKIDIIPVQCHAGSISEMEIEQDVEERIVCSKCCTVLPLGETVNCDGGICQNCEREGNISLARKRSRESPEKQAEKMLKLSSDKFSEVQIGSTVRVPIPDVDRARGSPRNILAVVSHLENGLYKLCTKNGTLKHKFTRSEFNPCLEKFILLENIEDTVKEKKISLREAAAQNSILGGQGYKRCHCKGGCKNNKCACRSSNKICNSKCHSSLPCANKNDY